MSEKQQLISPRSALEQVAAAIPEDCRENLVVVGSLAAGYYFFGDNGSFQVRTKDADCLLSPRIRAVAAGIAVAERLFAERWTFHSTKEFPAPGTAETPEKDLPVVRLKPPGSEDWFIEFLTVPESAEDLEQRYIRLPTSHGHFSLCSFGFLALTDYKPIVTEFGISIARPEMMALANLLHHPTIGAQTMSGPIGGREIKRSNKDLGRVLALAWLAERRAEGTLVTWGDLWVEALQARFPDRWREFTLQAGRGVRELLTHLATPLDTHYDNCLCALVVLGQHTASREAPGRPCLIADAESTVCQALFQHAPTGYKEGLENLGSLVNHIVKYAPDLSDPVARQNIDKLTRGMAEREQEWLNGMESILDRFSPGMARVVFGEGADSEVLKKARHYFSSNEFFDAWSWYMVASHAVKVGITNLRPEEIQTLAEDVRRLFPVPFHLMSALLQKLATSSPPDLANQRHKRWNFIWDSMISFAIGPGTIDESPVFMVTADGEIIDAAKTAGVHDNILSLAEYITGVGAS